jgi:hypothetical protein
MSRHSKIFGRIRECPLAYSLFNPIEKPPFADKFPEIARILVPEGADQ